MEHDKNNSQSLLATEIERVRMTRAQDMGERRAQLGQELSRLMAEDDELRLRILRCHTAMPRSTCPVCWIDGLESDLDPVTVDGSFAVRCSQCNWTHETDTACA